MLALGVDGSEVPRGRDDAVLGILGAQPGDLSAFQSTLGRTAIRQIETMYVADLMVELVSAR